MKVAVIDDGINNGIIKNCESIEHYCISKEKTIEIDKITLNRVTHGTICAYMLTQITNRIELVDIRVFNSNNASVEDVILALEWCYDHSISVINISFGTLNFLDYKKMTNILQRLIDKVIYIVSAHNNYNIRSYPAIHRKVFSVRKDIGNILRDGEFGYQLCDGLSMENSFIAHYDDIKGFDMVFSNDSNSFAAPIITGHISKYLVDNPEADYDNLLHYLIKKSFPKSCKGNNIQKRIEALSLPVNIPVIAFYMEDRLFYQKIRNMLACDGYQIISFADSDDIELGIPFELYCDKEEVLTYNIISTLGFIYEADIFLLCLNEYRYYSNNIWEIIDLLIVEEKSGYCIKYCDGNYKCENLSAIQKYICEFFGSED